MNEKKRIKKGVSQMAKDLAVQNEKAVALRDYMQGDKIKNQLAAALPKWLTADRLLRIVFTSVMKNPKLLDCTRESILSSVMQCAQLGLEPILGRAYLIPYDNRKNVGGTWIKVSECQMQIGYQGLVDLARRTDTIADVWGANVYENDEFGLQYGMDRNLYHVPWFMDAEKRRAGEPGDVIGAYVVWKLKDRTMHPEFMPLIDIHKRRERSQSYNFAETGDPKNGGGKRNSVWHQWPEEMNLKTVIKHSSKLIPASIEFMQAIELDDAQHSGLEAVGVFEDSIQLPDPVEKKRIETDSTAGRAPGGETASAGAQDIEKRFAAVVGEIAYDPLISEFIHGTATMNNSTVVKIYESAIENVQPFVNAFKNWKSKKLEASGGGEPAGADDGSQGSQGSQEKPDLDLDRTKAAADAFVKKWIRLHANSFEKFVNDNAAEFERQPDWVITKAQGKWVNFGFNLEQWPTLKPAGNGVDLNAAGGNAAGEGKGSGAGSNVQPGANQTVEITQTDEWQEIAMLQERYPDIYNKLAPGRDLTSVVDLVTLINEIEAAVQAEESGSGDISNRF